MNTRLTCLCAIATLAMAGHAQAQSAEDRLRDALRQSVAQMRAAQDQAAQAQSDLQKAQQDRTALQTQLDAATAKQAEAKPAAPPADLARMNDALSASRQQAATLQAALAKYQTAYQGLSAQAQAQDRQGQALSHGLQGQTQALESCKAENRDLMKVGEDILHLYQTQDFRSLLIRSYEPLIGTAKVRLENLVQDYDDKIHNQEYVAPRAK
jgi:chromosome segregation ATPase